MRLDSKLSKLEQRAKKTLRCDWCRYILVDTPPSLEKTVVSNTDDYAPTICPWCNQSYSLNLTGMTEHQRFALLIFNNKQNGEMYTDKRVAAAEMWFHASRVVVSWKDGKLQKQIEREEQKGALTYQQKREAEKAQEAKKVTPQGKIKERAYAFYRKMAARERELYGPAKHDLEDQIARISHLEPARFGYAPAPYNYMKMGAKEKAIRTVIYKASVMQICEAVIWGAPLPVTTEILKHANDLAQSFAEERDFNVGEKAEADRQKEEERKRKAEESLASARAATKGIKPEPVPPPAAERLIESVTVSDMDAVMLPDVDAQGRKKITRPAIAGRGARVEEYADSFERSPYETDGHSKPTRTL